jgi:hypothetical protein
MRGGKREGAGRKAGVPNKSNQALRAEIAETGETPLQYMIRVMRDDEAETPRRDEMAKSAAPYVHNKLAAVEHTGKDGEPLPESSMTPRDLARAVLGILREAGMEKSK